MGKSEAEKKLAELRAKAAKRSAAYREKRRAQGWTRLAVEVPSWSAKIVKSLGEGGGKRGGLIMVEAGVKLPHGALLVIKKTGWEIIVQDEKNGHIIQRRVVFQGDWEFVEG